MSRYVSSSRCAVDRYNGPMNTLARKAHAYLVLPHLWAVLVVVGATGAFGLLASGGDPEPRRFVLLLLGMPAPRPTCCVGETCCSESNAPARVSASGAP